MPVTYCGTFPLQLASLEVTPVLVIVIFGRLCQLVYRRAYMFPLTNEVALPMLSFVHILKAVTRG